MWSVIPFLQFDSCPVVKFSDTAEEVLPTNKSVSEFHFVWVDLVCVCVCVFFCLSVFVSW